MIRPLLIAAGSRGDIEPHLALVDGFTKSTSVEHTTLAVPEEYIYLVPESPKVTVVSLSFNLDDCLQYMPAFSQPQNAEKMVAQDPTIELKKLAVIIRALVLPNTQRIVALAEKSKSTVVISTVFTSSISNIIYEKLGIPHITLHLQPIFPSAYYPDILQHPEEAAVALTHLREGRTEQAFNESNMISHRTSMEAIAKPQIEDINVHREKLGMGPLSFKTVFEINTGIALDTHILIAVQSQLMARTPDLPPSAHIVGSLASAYIPPGWIPDSSHAELTSFIKKGPRPVAVTYGSMDAQGVADQATRSLLSGLRAADVQRVVLLPGQAQLGLHHLSNDNPGDAQLLAWAKDRVFVTKGNVQYAWLFPQCAMVFCHCGAGTTSAALRAGIPVLGTPIMADQKFFVELLRQMKLGTRVGSTGLASITAEEVEQAVRFGASEEISKNAREFGEEEKRRDESAAKVCQMIVDLSK